MRSRILATALAVVMSMLSIGPALAAGGQFGNLNGTIVTLAKKAPIAGAIVVAKSGTGTYTATTDAKGSFTIFGMSVDSYTVTITAKGFDSVNIPGVIVFGDETDTVGTVALSATSLKTIATVASRSASSAYQPSQTIDSYTVNQGQILQTTGKADTTNENAILLSVPGVTLTNAGTVTIRGGAAYEVGYQYDGVTFKEPFLGNNGSNGLVNGLGSVQVVEGAGDATQGGVGAGVINVIPQRGYGPGSGTADFEVGGPNFSHQLAFNYGFSTPNNRFSEYFAYTGQRFAPYNGYSFTPLNQYSNQFATTYQTNDQFVNNFFYNFGKNNHETLQMLYTNIAQQGYQGFSGPGYSYYPYDQTTQSFYYGLTGYTPSQYASLIGLAPGTPSTDVPIRTPQQNFSNNTRFLKFEYDNRLNPTTYFDLRYYNWESLQASDNSYTLGAWQTGTPGIESTAVTGGPTVGMSADLVHQIGSNITVSLEAQYNVLHPIWDGYEPQLQMLAPYISALPNQIGFADWLPGGYFCGGNSTGTDYFNCASANSVANTRVPSWGIGYNKTYFQNWGAGLRFQYSPTDKLKFDLGVRDEGQNQHWFSQLDGLGQSVPSTGYNVVGCAAYAASSANYAQCPVAPINNPYDVAVGSWTNQVLHPTELQPRASISY